MIEKALDFLPLPPYWYFIYFASALPVTLTRIMSFAMFVSI